MCYVLFLRLFKMYVMLRILVLMKYCWVGQKAIRFHSSQPDIGIRESTDKAEILTRKWQFHSSKLKGLHTLYLLSLCAAK